MLCAHCGRELPEGAGICPLCGSPVSTGDPFTPGAGAGPAGGGGKKKGLLIGIGAAVVALLIILIAFGPALLNGLVKLTSSPEKYCRYVLKKNFADSSFTANLYDSFVYQRLKGQEDVGVSGEISLVLSDDMLGMVEDELGVDDLEAFGDLKVSYDQQKKGDQVSMEVKCSSGKDTFLSAHIVYDGGERVIYARVPEINKTYAKIDLEDILEDEDLEQLDAVIASSDKWAEAFPDPKDAQKMLQRYMNVIIDQIDNVDEDKDKLEIGDVEQSVTVLTMDVDEDLVSNVMVALCKEAANDKDLEKVITQLMDNYIEMSGDSGVGSIYDDGAEIWDEIAEGLEECEEEFEDLDLMGRKYQLSLYVSGTGRVQGAELTMSSKEHGSEKERMTAAYARKGSRIAMEYVYEYKNDYMSENITLTGDGKIASGKVNADFTLKVDGEKLSFRVEKLDLKGLKKGRIDGSILMEMKQFKDELSRAGLKDLKDQTLVISFLFSGKENRVEIALKEGKDVFASLTVAGKIGKAGSVNIPSDSECLQIEEEDDLRDYVEDCDLDGLTDSLEDLGFPEEMLELFQSAGGALNYIEKSRISADFQLADSVHTAVLTAMLDPEIVNDPYYNTAFLELTSEYDITQYSTGSGNVILDGAAEILGVTEMSELSDRILSSGATGRILVSIVGSYSVQVELEGTDDGRGNVIGVQ